jgi:hypothetical protein
MVMSDDGVLLVVDDRALVAAAGRRAGQCLWLLQMTPNTYSSPYSSWGRALHIWREGQIREPLCPWLLHPAIYLAGGRPAGPPHRGGGRRTTFLLRVPVRRKYPRI